MIALTARLVPNFILNTGAGYDIESFKIVGDLVLKGEDVYSSPETVNRHPYLPFQMYWMALSHGLTEKLRLPFEEIVRLLPIFSDVAIALVLYSALLKSLSPDRALIGGLLYATNPITTYVSAYHGQFDALPSLFTLIALYWFSMNTEISGIWLGLGILSKSWPVLAVPPILGKIKLFKKKLFFVASISVILILGIVLYILLTKANPQLLITRVFSYNRGIGVWGYTYIFRLLSLIEPKFTYMFEWLIQYSRWITIISLCLVWLWTNSLRKFPQEIFFAMIVSFFFMTHAFAIQYLAWIIPFAILCQEFSWLKRFVIAAFAYMFLAYTTLILGMFIDNLVSWPQADWLIIIPAGLPAWLVCMGWTWRLLRNHWEVDTRVRMVNQT